MENVEGNEKRVNRMNLKQEFEQLLEVFANTMKNVKSDCEK